jgi:hypothetical protein
MSNWRKVVGTLGCLGIIGLGVAVMLGAVTPEELDSSGGSSRSRGLKNILSGLLETLGPVPTGLIACGVGGLIIFLMWRPKKPAPDTAARR